MKCPNCGGQLGIEDETCPYCGTPNAMAVQHQSDMAKYRAEYARTQHEVLENTSFMKRHGSWLVILVVLLVALVGGIVLQAVSWDIGYSIRENNAKRDMAADKQVLDGYLEQGDYGKFVGYYDANDYYLMSDDPYRVVRAAANSYTNLIECVSSIKDPDNYSFSPDSISYTCGYLAEDLNRIYTLEEQYSRNIGEYLPDSMRVYIDDIRERAGFIATTYFGLTQEDVESIPDMSTRQLAEIIEERVSS